MQVTPQSTRRRIPLSRRSHIIGFQPLITGTPVHESALERDFVTLTGFMHPRAVITSQPVTIFFLDGFQRRRYTPDYLIQCSGELAAELIEVKYARDLRENWARLEPRIVQQEHRRESGGPIVVTEHAAESLAPFDGWMRLAYDARRFQQAVF